MGFIPLMEIFISSANAIEFPNAPKRESPQSTAAGGRRGGCVRGNLPITPLTPSNDNFIKTISSQPQFFVYIPPTQAKFAQFILREENGKDLDIQEIPITATDQIITINVSNKINLETDKKYVWEISLICNPMFINTSNHTKGMIEKVSLEENINNQLSTNLDNLQRAQILANEGVWQDTLSLVATLKESQPKQWQELLTSVGLDALLDKNLVKSSEN
ncbi:membrane proteins related to metalloendopeptidases [Geminocystis sp. NIES-3708]|nr:membrane proteins related to metalloendopeptidases [Geminocystis sp. NIES-3708]